MWEHHGRGIRWHSGFPHDRRSEKVRIEVQQYQIVSTGIQPIGGQVDLLRCRKVDEAHLGQRRWAQFAPSGRGRPLLCSTQMDEFGGGGIHTISLPQPQRGRA
jgi:hypothetical protein